LTLTTDLRGGLADVEVAHLVQLTGGDVAESPRVAGHPRHVAGLVNDPFENSLGLLFDGVRILGRLAVSSLVRSIRGTRALPV
jgi:hypothetical protein